MSQRDYAILWVGATKAGGGAIAAGGSVLLTTPRHKLDGPEHQTADDTTNLDASTTQHGLLPKLSGDPADTLLGDGTWGPSSAIAELDDIPDVNAPRPADGDVLTWDATPGEWVASPPPGGSTFTDLDWYNVEDYGAVHNGSTDDTVAIQAAITACMTAGGGTVYFPLGIYQVSGALVSTGTFNSQLTIPNVTFGGEPKAIRFLGAGPNPTYGGSGIYGSVIRSDWNGSISGHPAIISAGLWQGTGANWSSVMVSFEDLVIVAHDDPKLSALQMTCATDVRITNVQIRTTTAAPASLPTHSNAVGYEGPYGYLSQVPDEVHNLDVYGFYVGMRPAEQTTGGDVGFAYCVHAIEFIGDRSSGVYTFWPNYFSKVVIVSCPRGLVFSGDLRWLNIGLFAVQHDPGTFATVYDIDDASNYWRGFISYNAVETTGTPSEEDLLVNGATGGSLHWGHGQYWKLNSVVEIPTGTDPATNPATGRKLYTASATGHLSVRTPAGGTVDLEDNAPTGAAGGDLSGTYPNPSVVDDSHSHTSATLPATTSGGGASEHAHIDETHLSDGSTTTYTLDNAYEAGSVIAWNTTSLARLSVTEVLPDQATVSAAGSSGDRIVFEYAATLA